MQELSERLRAEFGAMEPTYVDGVAGVLNLGVNVALYLFRYGTSIENGEVCRLPALTIIQPKAALICGTNCTVHHWLGAQRKRPVELVQ